MPIDLLRKLIREVLEEAELEEAEKSSKKKKKSRREQEDSDVGRPRKRPNDPLAQWVDDHGGTEAAADKTGLSVSHLNKLMRGGETDPSLKTAVEIENMTAGKISVEDWV